MGKTGICGSLAIQHAPLIGVLIQEPFDDQIARRALKIITWDTTVPEDKVKIRVQNGWITLSGEVEWNYQRSDAESAVRKLPGVMGITNGIVVQPHADAGNIRRRINDALKRNARLDAGQIRVVVEDGKVTLEGQVPAWHERAIAERAAWSAAGVSTVEDRIQVS